MCRFDTDVDEETELHRSRIDNNVPRTIYFREETCAVGEAERDHVCVGMMMKMMRLSCRSPHLETRTETAQSVPLAAISTIRSDQFRVRLSV